MQVIAYEIEIAFSSPIQNRDNGIRLLKVPARTKYNFKLIIFSFKRNRFLITSKIFRIMMAIKITMSDVARKWITPDWFDNLKRKK